jgi:hypothetical protein
VVVLDVREEERRRWCDGKHTALQEQIGKGRKMT